MVRAVTSTALFFVSVAVLGALVFGAAWAFLQAQDEPEEIAHFTTVIMTEFEPYLQLARGFVGF